MTKIKLFLLAIVAIASMNVNAGTQADSIAARAQAAVNKFVSNPNLRHSQASVMVMRLDSAQIVASNMLDVSVVTASTMKTITSSAALETLGANFRFTTPVFAVGELNGTTLAGDIVIVGEGDPTLGSRHFTENPNITEEILNAVKAMGIKKIEGKILVDDSLIPYPDYSIQWEVGDLAWSYGMGVHALNFSDNKLNLSFTARNGEIENACITPTVPGLDVVNKLTPGNDDNIDMLLESAHPALVVAGTARDNEKYNFNLANPMPWAMLADSVRRVLIAADINVKGKDNAVKEDFANNRILLVQHKSPSLNIIIKSLLDRSDNMFTEALLRAIARNNGKVPTIENGVAAVRKIWMDRGLDVSALFQNDGSGLARTNRASAHFFADMLNYMAQRRYNGMKLADLMPLANARIGKTLAAAPLCKRLAVKSGSMNQVQTFVGYYPADNPQWAWAILVNTFNGTRADLKDNMGQLLINVFEPQK